MNNVFNLLIIDLAGSNVEEGHIDVLENADFATVAERDACVADFAKDHDLTAPQLLANGYVMVCDRWAR